MAPRARQRLWTASPNAVMRADTNYDDNVVIVATDVRVWQRWCCRAPCSASVELDSQKSTEFDDSDQRLSVTSIALDVTPETQVSRSWLWKLVEQTELVRTQVASQIALRFHVTLDPRQAVHKSEPNAEKHDVILSWITIYFQRCNRFGTCVIKLFLTWTIEVQAHWDWKNEIKVT